MRIFLDTADAEKIKKYSSTGLIDGITTNPTSLASVGGNPLQRIEEICSLIPHGAISVEVTETEPDAVYRQALKISKIAKNVVVKIPCYKDYYPIIARLVSEKIKLNITLVFTLTQSLYMCKLGVSYISPFVGRWDDLDVEGIDILYEVREMIDMYGYETLILAASLRSVRHLHKAITAGADIATLAPDVFEKSMEHPLTDQGMKKFLQDWKKLSITQFP